MNWKNRMKSTPKVELFSAEGRPVRVLEDEITNMPDGHSAKVYSNGVVEMYKDGEYKGDITKESLAKLRNMFEVTEVDVENKVVTVEEVDG